MRGGGGGQAGSRNRLDCKGETGDPGLPLDKTGHVLLELRETVEWAKHGVSKPSPPMSSAPPMALGPPHCTPWHGPSPASNAQQTLPEWQVQPRGDGVPMGFQRRERRMGTVAGGGVSPSRAFFLSQEAQTSLRPSLAQGRNIQHSSLPSLLL